ncbi:MAG: dihydroxy-acid dehydratase [Actinomycetia bacterium]|nr:dihydroxy-acid dehydratase [Actinomycetes bacterium]
MAQTSGSRWTRATLEVRSAGFDPAEMAGRNAVVTIAGAYTNAHRCNNRVERISELLAEAVAARGGQGLFVGAPAVSDALTQGSPNASYSLVSRDLVADCFEVGHRAQHADAMVVVSGCDKTGAAAMMPLARTNDFGLVIYPGTSSPGCVSFEPWASKGNNLTILDWAEARAALGAGRITDEEFVEVERNVMPGSGACGAMFTANTMSSITESLGMMLPRGASHPADYGSQSDIHDDVKQQVGATVDALYRLIDAGVRPRDVMTMEAFENAITTAYAMGGSTNMYLHLLAIARDAEVPLTIDRIQAVGEGVPLIANLQPHGPYSMVALHEVGGVPVVMRELLDNGFLHGDAMTVTGRTVAENLSEIPTLTELGDQDVVAPIADPLAPPNNHIIVLTGNLAPESCVLKLSGKTLESGQFTGTARVFDNEPDAMDAIRAGAVVAGDVVVVRNVGPKGGPGMPEMVALTVELQGRGLGKDVALITDGRFSGVSHGIIIGHISPEAALRGPLAAVENGDTITIDPIGRTLDVEVGDDELRARMEAVQARPVPSSIPMGSVLRKYAKHVSSARYGCIQ